MNVDVNINSMKVYKANKKGLVNYLLIVFLVLPVVIFLLDTDMFTAKPFILLPLFIPTIFVLWMYFDTVYKIENGRLIYRSAFLKGQIEISTITEITKGETMWVGIKPALSKEGLIITFNKQDKVYLAPESNDEMISHLLELNSKIKIVERK